MCPAAAVPAGFDMKIFFYTSPATNGQIHTFTKTSKCAFKMNVSLTLTQQNELRPQKINKENGHIGNHIWLRVGCAQRKKTVLWCKSGSK